ncbi:hypothetical protein PQX77_005658 [Marasmius sp. AFHP31]|nr:hypothetical protein PQX77_005658 [Marasmius sp. AFHP31]
MVFAFLDQGRFLEEFATTTIPSTQREGQIPFTFTYLDVSSFRVEGHADGFFTAQPTAILAAKPAMTATSDPSDNSSTTPPSSNTTDTPPTNIPSTPPAIASDNSESTTSHANIIGGAVGGGGAVVILLIVLFLFRRKRNQQKPRDSEQATVYSHPPEPRVDPYLLEKSATSLISRGKGQGQTDQRTNTTRSDHYQSSDSRIPPSASSRSYSSRPAGPPVSEDGPSAFAAMQAQMRMMMQRLERIEAAESEAPPDYVSSYSGGR